MFIFLIYFSYLLSFNATKMCTAKQYAIVNNPFLFFLFACSLQSPPILQNLVIMINPNQKSVVGGRSVNFTSWNVKALNHPVKRNKVLTHL